MPRPKRLDSDPNRPKRVTLQDIAKAAGLHVMTVSDALSGKRSVAPATQERVKQIAQELNYVPNYAAKALASGRTGMVAVMCGSLREAYYANIMASLEEYMRADRYVPILLRRPVELKELLDTTSGMALDGAITIDMHPAINAEAMLKPLRNKPEVPCVSIGTHEWNMIDSVVVDLRGGVTAALNIMLSGGRKRVAYIVTHHGMGRPEETRANAYFASMAKWGRSPEIINLNTNVLTQVEPELKAYIRQNGCPDALLCQNDETAMSTYRTLRGLGLRIPDDVMLAGCDGQLHMKYFDPPLSTVVQPLEEMCEVAWKFLKKRMADPALPYQRTVLEGELIVRESLLASLDAKPNEQSGQRSSTGSLYPGWEDHTQFEPS